MSFIVFEKEDTYEVEPKDIDLSNKLANTFGKLETELAACSVVELCKEKGGWFPFYLDELKKVYEGNNKNKGYPFNLYGLCDRYDEPFTYAVSGGWIIRINEKYYITDSFVKRVKKHKK